MTAAKTIVLVLVVLLAPVVAHADYLYTVTVTSPIPTEFSFQTPLLGSGDVTSITNITGNPVEEVAWNSAASAFCTIEFFSIGVVGSGCAAWEYTTETYQLFPFTAGSFEALGTYISESGTVTVSITCTDPTPNGDCPASTPTPEPSSLLLLSSGALGVAGLFRRRIWG